MNTIGRFAVGALISSAALVSTLPALAASETMVKPVPRQDALIQALVKRFSLNETDVRAFFADQHEVRFQEQLKRIEVRLAEAVKAGKLTEAQKTAILAKMKEVRSQVMSWKSLPDADRQAKMKQLRTDLQAWAKAQGIPESYLHLLGGMHPSHSGMKHGNVPMHAKQMGKKMGWRK